MLRRPEGNAEIVLSAAISDPPRAETAKCRSPMISDFVISSVPSRPKLKQHLQTVLEHIGYNTTDWVRVVMYQRCFSFVRSLGPERLDVLEISAGPQWRGRFAFRSYMGTEYPDFDICDQPLPRKF